MLTLGDVYDLVCPSEYLIMKLMAEEALVPLSDAFFDRSDEKNYYSRGAAPFIREIFENSQIGGEPWSKYAAGYRWGVTGLVYSPETVTEEQVSTWKVLSDPAFAPLGDHQGQCPGRLFRGYRRDQVRPSDFPEAFLNDPDYKKNLETEMNDTSRR